VAFFNEDVEATGDPEPVRRFKDAIATSNAVLIAIPEYNGVVPGVLGRIGAVVVPDPQVLVPRASRLFEEHVDLHDESTHEEIRQLVEAVAHWCRRVQPEEPVSTQSVTAP
jgi:NADPH-dependent FMN reductase